MIRRIVNAIACLIVGHKKLTPKQHVIEFNFFVWCNGGQGESFIFNPCGRCGQIFCEVSDKMPSGIENPANIPSREMLNKTGNPGNN
jgi:hypothetical protein